MVVGTSEVVVFSFVVVGVDVSVVGGNVVIVVESASVVSCVHCVHPPAVSFGE